MFRFRFSHHFVKCLVVYERNTNAGIARLLQQGNPGQGAFSKRNVLCFARSMALFAPPGHLTHWKTLDLKNQQSPRNKKSRTIIQYVSSIYFGDSAKEMSSAFARSMALLTPPGRLTH